MALSTAYSTLSVNMAHSTQLGLRSTRATSNSRPLTGSLTLTVVLVGK